jgi:hypothetical protein
MTMTSARLLLPLLCALVACDKLDNCPDAQAPKIIDTGTTDPAARMYESAPWGGTLDRVPPDTDVHFVHGLGHAPWAVHTYLAFSSDGTSQGDVSESAGNQGRIQCVDAREIVISNDTCEEDFYIRVVAISTGNESTKIFCSPQTETDGAAGAASSE